MKRLLMLLVVITLISCNTQKVSEKKKLNSQINTEVSKDVSSREESNVQAKEITRIDSAMLAQVNFLSRKVVNLESEIIRFDTSKPVDSGTGKPPVLEIIKYRSREDSEVDYKSITEKLTSMESEFNILKSEVNAYKMELDSVSNIKEKSTSKTDNQTNNALKLLLSGIIVGLLIPGVVWLIRIFK
ncbi:MAG: hypothetical protein Q7J05_04135 [Paludibacter sp.]|nr:hypothetical protein [Paludibacter sp.]